MKILACYSLKGGVGKTATAVNLAYWAALGGYKTLHKETALDMRKRYKRFPRYAILYATEVAKMGIHRASIDTFAQCSQANRSYLALWREIETELNGR